jgi:peptide deformylase
MAVRPVLTIGDPRLRVHAAPVEAAAGDWRADAADLRDTLADLRRRLGFGRGLAAPQIGVARRMIAFDCALGSFVAIDPAITWRSAARRAVADDCFSVPGRRIPVLRHDSVALTCRDADGRERHYAPLPFALAELVQHELDHLDGVLMVDRAIGP